MRIFCGQVAFRVLALGTLLLPFLEVSRAQAPEQVPLYGLFEVSVVNTTAYDNPFAEVELRSVFTSPSGRTVHFFGFYDGDGVDSQTGNVWKQRFMPDEIGSWRYELTFTDGSGGRRGQFDVIAAGAMPGPWRQNPHNPRWLMTARGEHFLPTAAYIHLPLAAVDAQDAFEWARRKGYDTIFTPSLNAVYWGDGWPNPTPFVAAADNLDGAPSGAQKRVNYDHLNLAAWRSWDEMIRAAGEAGLYIAATDAPSGYWGGQSGVGTVYPPAELAYFPERFERFNTDHNLRVLRYFVARQAAFWNIALWGLYPGEIFDIKERSEVIQYGEYFASITPFKRLITAQDVEQDQDGFGTLERAWLTAMRFPNARKLNAVQFGPVGSTDWQQAEFNNRGALRAYKGFPVFGTETLWEGQPRAQKPLPMIWGSMAAGAHTVWADWRYDDGVEGGRWGSLGRAWIPLKPLDEHVFQVDQLGVDTVGDEQLKIATDHMRRYEYWKMAPHNELVAAGSEAYCLAEPGRQYMVYVPRGGAVALDLSAATNGFEAQWLDPETGMYSESVTLQGGDIRLLDAPGERDWILDVKASDFSLDAAVAIL